MGDLLIRLRYFLRLLRLLRGRNSTADFNHRSTPVLCPNPALAPALILGRRGKAKN